VVPGLSLLVQHTIFFYFFLKGTFPPKIYFSLPYFKNSPFIANFGKNTFLFFLAKIFGRTLDIVYI
jgi:hypothetical protein